MQVYSISHDPGECGNVQCNEHMWDDAEEPVSFAQKVEHNLGSGFD